MIKIRPASGLRVLVILSLALSICISCGGGAEDLSFTNPEWRSGMNSGVTFPLPERITLRIGVGGEPPPETSQTIAWLEDYTNIDLVFETLISSPGDILLGGLIREGKLPDIMPEGRLQLGEESTRELFVDFLEFPELTPSFYKVISENPSFGSSMLARTTHDDRLYTLGSYDPDKFLNDGVIAYRRDLFEKHDLAFDTWPELIESLRFLKKEYPDSYPLGGSFGSLVYHFPTWWGSGLDPDHIIYFDLHEDGWRMGLREERFLDSIRVLTELAQEGLVSPDAFVMKDSDLRGQFSTDTVFLAPYSGLTGPSFGYTGSGYGALGEDGEWNGEGKWIEAMPLPKRPDGGPSRYSSRFLDVAGLGWLVYNQSEYVGEAIALLDLLFSTEAALVLELGPQGQVWDLDGDAVVLRPPFAQAYKNGWVDGLREEMLKTGLQVGSPLAGLRPDLLGLFGIPEVEKLKYYISHDLQQNRPGIDVLYQPGVRSPEHYEFQSDRASLVVSLQTAIESTIATIVVGQKPFSSLEELANDMSKYADKLLDLYNTWCIIPERELLPVGTTRS